MASKTGGPQKTNSPHPSFLKRGIISLFIMLLALAMIPGTSYPEKPARKDHTRTVEAAISLARQGKMEQAISIMEPMVKQHPEDKKLIGDYLVILGWAGKDQEALSVSEGMDLGAAPAYVMNSLAKSARNIRMFDRSLEWYKQALRMDPNNLQSRVGLAMALSDAGRADEALNFLEPLLAKQRINADLLFAKAYACESKGDKLQALWIYEDILRLYPGTKDAERLRILAVSSLRAPGVALSLSGQNPSLLSADELDRIQGDMAAVKVIWGSLPPASVTQRLAETDEAIAMLDESLRRYAEQGEDRTSGKVLRARFDRIIALRNRYRMDDVIAEYEALAKEGLSLPQYVISAAGDAYLYLEHPREAAAMYSKALELNQESYNIRLSLFWAYIELGDFKQAIQIVDKLAAEQPTWRINRVQGLPPIYEENDKKLLADSAAALGRAFADDLKGAQERLEGLSHAAPFNHDLRQRLAYVYLWRGWPRLALEEFDLILPVEPDFLNARMGKAYALMDLREYEKAEVIMNDLTDHYPEDKKVRKLNRNWELYNKRILTTSAGYGAASAANQDTDSLQINTYLYSAPLNYHYRIFIHSFYETAKIINQDIANQREGLGLQYSGPGKIINLEINRNKGSRHDADLSGNLNWDLDDHWTAGVSYDTFSLDAPLRGRLNDITAQSAGLHLSYAVHESAGARLNLQRLKFSDDNIRESGSLSLKQRMYNGPYLKIPVSLDLYGSRNSERNRPYFNPEKDLSGTLTVDFRWLTWRWYTRSFSQNLAFTGGYYWQKGFGTGNVRSVRYEHDWNLSDTFSILYGVSLNRRIYDGNPENSTWTYLNLTWRF